MQTQRNYRTRYPKRPSVTNNILYWSKTVKSMAPWNLQKGINYFLQVLGLNNLYQITSTYTLTGLYKVLKPIYKYRAE